MKIKRVFDNILFRRFLYSILVLFGLSILIFTLARLLPGDPARLALGPRAPEDVVQRYREQLHLDQPIYIQYFYWLNDVIHFSLGQSLVTFRDVSDDIREFLPATLELILFSGIILVIGALILGVISGRRPGSIVDNAMRLFAYVGISIPSFVWAIIFQLVFAYWLNLLPAVGRISNNVIPPPRVTGFMTIDSLLAGNLPAFIDSIEHLILPATALAIGPIAQDARILRANLIENIGKDYVLNFKSHGIPETTIYFKYALKPSLIPVIAVMGLDIASLLGNAFLVELIFNWPGLSRYGINAMLRKDLNAIVGVTLVIGVIFIIANLIVDLIIYYLDPRIKYREKG
jgi:peptide/nickel transport system permease protein